MPGKTFSPTLWIDSRKRLQSQSSADVSREGSFKSQQVPQSQQAFEFLDEIPQHFSWRGEDSDTFINPPIPTVRNNTRNVFYQDRTEVSSGMNRTFTGMQTISRPISDESLMRSSTPDSVIDTLPRNSSGDCNCSIISGLSADENSTVFDDSRKTKSSSALPLHRPSRSLVPDFRHRPRSADEAPVVGRDFGDVFNHLITGNVDLLDDLNSQQNIIPPLSKGLERPQPIQFRASSENSLIRSSTLQQEPSAHHHTTKSSLPAHATLRECLETMKANDSTFRMSKPNPLHSRSTSSTVFSSNATIVSGASGGAVWNTSSPPRMAQKTQSFGCNSVSENHPVQRQVPFHRQSGSCVSFGTDYTPDYSIAVQSYGTSNKSTPSHSRSMTDGDWSTLQSLQSLALDDHSNMEVSTGASMDSCKSGIPRKSRKPSIKDEFKFIISKVVPSPLKKVSFVKEKVKLERSTGCLT